MDEPRPEFSTPPSLDPATAGVARPTRYSGNTNDLIALAAAVSGLCLCGYMASNGALCCLPILLGAAGLALAKDAEDPKRARNLALIGIGSAALIVLVIAACIAAYIAVIAISAAGTGSIRIN